MTRLIRPVHASTVVERFRHAYMPLVDGALHLQTIAVAERGWAAVPAESGSHFTATDAKNMAKAVQSLDGVTCIALLTEPLSGIEPCVEIRATMEGLLEFSRLYGHFGWVLGTVTATWAVLCTVEDYCVIAGPRGFVARALGTTIEAARAAFDRFAEERGDASLRRVAARYLNLDGMQIG